MTCNNSLINKKYFGAHCVQFHQDPDHEDLINKAKIEYLENWVLKQDESIQELSEKLSRLDKNGVLVQESTSLVTLNKKVVGLEIDVNSMKFNSSKKETIPKALNLTKCKECDEVFTWNSDLEKHMIQEHEHDRKFGCEVCDKKFVLEWRLKKHMKMHVEEVNKCHFFNNNKNCPYDDIGCKFLHEPSGKCKFDDCSNQLCQFNHSDELSAAEESDLDDYSIDENQCHI